MIRNPLVNPRARSRLVRIVAGASVAGLVVLIIYLYRQDFWRETATYYRYFFEFKRLRSFVLSFGPFAPAVFIILQALQVVVAPIPGEITGFVGGLLFGKVMGTLYSTVGLTLGSLVAFGIARRFGAALVRRIVKKEYIDRFDYFVTHRGLYVAFILFLIPGFPKDSLCYLLGLTRLRVLDFILMNVFGRLPGTLMLGLQGDAVRNKHYVAFSVLLLSSICLMVAMYVTRNYLIITFTRVWASFRQRLQNRPDGADT